MIAGFFGTMSSGKGVVSTAFLRWLKERNDKRVIANCFLNEKNFIQLSTEELYLRSKTPSFFRYSYLYITELHNIIDARRTNSLMNTNFTQFLTQLGKIDCSVVYDSQLFNSQIDVRMREFTDVRFKCERYKVVNGQLVPALFDDRIIKEKVAIKISLDRSTDHIDNVKTLGFYLPTQEDYAYYKTREVVTLDREKFLKS